MKKIFIGIFILFSMGLLSGCNENTNTEEQKPEVEQEKPELEEDNNTTDIPKFEVLDLEYTGPKLDSKWFDINEICVEGEDHEGNFEYQGTGIAFEVSLAFAVDGDTAYFDLPESFYSIYPRNKSFRFLNMDTEETYGGGEEEWGKPASNYTKNLLENAYKIVLQNDPNEGIYDIYERGLAWIWVQETANSEFELLNYKVIQQGLAQTAYLWGAGETIYYGDLTYTEWMLKAEAESIEFKRGYHGNFYDPYWDYETNSPNDNWNSIAIYFNKKQSLFANL